MPAGTGAVTALLLVFHLIARLLLVIGGAMWLVAGFGHWPPMPNALAAAVGLTAAVQIVTVWAEPGRWPSCSPDAPSECQ
jgi:hypothetical protein